MAILSEDGGFSDTAKPTGGNWQTPSELPIGRSGRKRKQGRAGTLQSPRHAPRTIKHISMEKQRTINHYDRLLDDLGDREIERYDREESGCQGGGSYEDEQSDGMYTFRHMSRGDQVALLSALDAHLSPTARVNFNTPSSYALKHVAERYIGFYVSNLQVKTAMRILGYQRGGDDLNPHFNITKRSYREFSDLSGKVADRRHEAKKTLERLREEQACAKWFKRTAM